MFAMSNRARVVSHLNILVKKLDCVFDNHIDYHLDREIVRDFYEIYYDRLGQQFYKDFDDQLYDYMGI